MRSPATLLLLALLVPAAAGGADPAPPPPPLAHRSSIAAVLAHRGTLQLTADQVKVLEHADSVLAREQDAVRTAAAVAADDAPRVAPGGKSSSPQPPGPGSPGGMSGGKVRPIPTTRRSGPDPAEVLAQQLDVLDSEAFLKVVETFPEPQREKAIEVASRYREQVYEQREREKAR
jgi:hypothetical protein